jgi:hypothetical protein
VIYALFFKYYKMQDYETATCVCVSYVV